MLLYFEWTPGLLCSHNIFAKEKTRITWSQLDDTWVLSYSLSHYASHPTCSSWRKAIVQEEDSCDSLRRARETLISGAFIAGFDTKVYEDLRIFYTIKIHLKHIETIIIEYDHPIPQFWWFYDQWSSCRKDRCRLMTPCQWIRSSRSCPKGTDERVGDWNRQS